MLDAPSPIPPSVQIIQAVFTLSAAVIAGAWAIAKVLRRHEHRARIEFSVDISFVGIQGTDWLIEVVALVDNKGLVRHTIENFSFHLRTIQSSDELAEGGPKINNQVSIPFLLKEGSWIPKNWGDTFIDPGIRTRYSYVSTVPLGTSFVLLHGRFLYSNGYPHTADKLAAVPSRDPRTPVLP